MVDTTWSTLEIAKLAVGAMTPMAIAVFGIYANRLSKKLDHMQWRNQKVIEKQLSIYDDLAPDLNDLLCYYTYVGTWKEVDPTDIVQMKRVIDKKVHLAAPLFPEEFAKACLYFQELCFETYTGMGRDARLRTEWSERVKHRQGRWNPEWASCFSPDQDVTNPKEIQKAYREIMLIFANCIGVQPACSVLNPGRIPTDIDRDLAAKA